MNPTLNQPVCVVTRRQLTQGRSAGLELIEVDNGALKIALLPQRGMGIWKAWLGGDEFGWRSPVQVPVHPSLVPIFDPSGLGWLEGFGELLCRCGLLSNGAPDFYDNGTLKYPLHGRLANLPADDIQIVHDAATGSVSVSGDIYESRLHFHHLRLRSTVTMRPGQPTFEVFDEVVNLSARPVDIQLMYHYNIGQPVIGAGAEVVAPIKKLVPRSEHAADGVQAWNTLTPPSADDTEQVYFAELHASQSGSTLVLLKNAQNTLGSSVRFNQKQLPYFVCWKNAVDDRDGFVCGIEPGTNFPNPRSFEGNHGRVVSLAAGQSVRFDLAFSFHQGEQALGQVVGQIRDLAANAPAQIFTSPTKDWCA